MELDDLKAAWQELDRKLDRQRDLSLQILRQGPQDRIRRGLRPLVWGQAFSMAGGLLTVLLSAAFWSSHLHTIHLLATGLLMHLYGVATILFGARILFLAGRIDYAQPVLEIQARLARLRRAYVLGGIWLGLPWFVLWIPCLEMAFVALFGADLFVHAPAVLAWCLLSGLVGWLPVLGLLLWARKRPALARRLEAFAAGRSLNEAQRQVEALARFEQE